MLFAILLIYAAASGFGIGMFVVLAQMAGEPCDHEAPAPVRTRESPSAVPSGVLVHETSTTA